MPLANFSWTAAQGEFAAGQYGHVGAQAALQHDVEGVAGFAFLNEQGTAAVAAVDPLRGQCFDVLRVLRGESRSAG